MRKSTTVVVARRDWRGWGEANSKQADCCRHKSINKRKQTQRDFHYLYFFPSIKYGKINEPLMSQEKTKFEKINFNCEKRKKPREITEFFNEYSWNCLNFEEVVHPNYDLGNSMFVFFWNQWLKALYKDNEISFISI